MRMVMVLGEDLKVKDVLTKTQNKWSYINIAPIIIGHFCHCEPQIIEVLQFWISSVSILL
jgi:hypothetical protein